MRWPKGDKLLFTDKQLRIMDLIASGHNTEEIARIEGISKSTAIQARYLIRRKVGLTSANSQGSKFELLHWMSQNGWEVPPHLLRTCSLVSQTIPERVN